MYVCLPFHTIPYHRHCLFAYMMYDVYTTFYINFLLHALNIWEISSSNSERHKPERFLFITSFNDAAPRSA
jgi:hypothetical protein